MYKSFDFEKTNFFQPERSIGQIWVVLAGDGQKIEMSAQVIFHSRCPC